MVVFGEPVVVDHMVVVLVRRIVLVTSDLLVTVVQISEMARSWISRVDGLPVREEDEPGVLVSGPSGGGA